MRRITLTLAALALLAACGDDDTEPAAETPEPTETTVDPNDALADALDETDDATRAQQSGADALERGKLNWLWDDLSQAERDEVCTHTRDVGVQDAGYEMVAELNASDVFIAPAIVMEWLSDNCDVDWNGDIVP